MWLGALDLNLGGGATVANSGQRQTFFNKKKQCLLKYFDGY